MRCEAAGVAPAVTGDHAGVAGGLEDRERLLARQHAHVVGLDDHALGHHPADEVRAERGQALRVAQRARGVDGQLPAQQPGRRDRVEEARDGRREARRRSSARCRGRACRSGPPARTAPVAYLLPALTTTPVVPESKCVPPSALSNLCTGKTDWTPSAWNSSSWRSICAASHARHAVVLAAAEDLRGLHAEDERDLAAVDDRARLRRARREPQEALARTAELRVDVVDEPVEVLRLLAGAGHLVAGVLLEGVELAQRAVLDEVGHHDPHAAAPGPLEPLPVAALVGQRLRARPAGERGPAVGAVGADRAARGEEVLERGAGAVRLVVGAVPQGHRDAVGAPRPPAVEAAAEEVEGADVDVVVEEAAHRRARARARERRAGRVDLDLGERRAALRGDEREHGRRARPAPAPGARRGRPRGRGRWRSTSA